MLARCYLICLLDSHKRVLKVNICEVDKSCPVGLGCSILLIPGKTSRFGCSARVCGTKGLVSEAARATTGRRPGSCCMMGLKSKLHGMG